MTQQTAFERHLQTGIAGLILAAILWAGNSLSGLQQTVTRLEERLVSIQSTVNSQTDRIDSVEREVQELKMKVDRLERRE